MTYTYMDFILGVLLGAVIALGVLVYAWLVGFGVRKGWEAGKPKNKN